MREDCFADSPFGLLPVDVLASCLSHLPTDERARSKEVCTVFRTASSFPIVWRTLDLASLSDRYSPETVLSLLRAASKQACGAVKCLSLSRLERFSSWSRRDYWEALQSVVRRTQQASRSCSCRQSRRAC